MLAPSPSIARVHGDNLKDLWWTEQLTPLPHRAAQEVSNIEYAGLRPKKVAVPELLQGESDAIKEVWGPRLNLWP